MKQTTTIVGFLSFALLCVDATGEDLARPPANAHRTITLAEAQELAVRSNPESKNIDEAVYQADMLVYRAWAMLLPNLSASGSITRNQEEIALGFPDFSAFDPANPTAPLPTSEMVIQEKWGKSFGLSANMTLFNPRSIPLIRNARDSAELARLSGKRQRNDLLFAVTSAYYQAHSIFEMIAIAEANVELAEELEQASAARRRTGQGTEVDTLRAKIRTATAKKELANTEDAYQVAKSALRRLIGLEGDFSVVDPEPSATQGRNLDALTTKALRERVELKEASMGRRIAERNKTETLMKWLPAFDVTYAWNWNSAEGFSGEHDQWALIFGARWNLFEGGGRIAELKSRQSEARVAENNESQLDLNIRNEVEQTLVEVNKRRRNVELAEEQTLLAEKNHRLVVEQYRAGLATSLDALDAATELSNQRTTRTLERLQFDIALLSLGKAVGEYHSLASPTNN